MNALFSAAASGWAGWALAHGNLGVQLTLLQPGGQSMPTKLLLANPDLKTQRHLCIWPIADEKDRLLSLFAGVL